VPEKHPNLKPSKESEALILLNCSTKKESYDVTDKRSFYVWGIEYFEKDISLNQLDYPSYHNPKKLYGYDENIKHNA
jgi:hypothetical protein